MTQNAMTRKRAQRLILIGIMDDSTGGCQHGKFPPSASCSLIAGVAAILPLSDHGMSSGLTEHNKVDKQERLARIREALGPRSIVLIGLMGAGKTAVGRRLANRLEHPVHRRR